MQYITMKKKLSDNKGFVASDGLIAVLIIAIFTGIIATLLYNIYISNTSIKRMSTANNYIINILEFIDKIDYNDLDNTDILKENYEYLDDVEDFENPEDEDLERMWVLEGNPTDNNGYTINIILDKYKLNEDTQDLVRQITVTVNYKL